MREIVLFSGKIYTAGTNFTQPLVMTVATNLNSVPSLHNWGRPNKKLIAIETLMMLMFPEHCSVCRFTSHDHLLRVGQWSNWSWLKKSPVSDCVVHVNLAARRLHLLPSLLLQPRRLHHTQVFSSIFFLIDVFFCCCLNICLDYSLAVDSFPFFLSQGN